MPLVKVNTKEEWKPATGEEATPKGRATLILARLLPAAVSYAVSTVDRQVLVEDHVRVDFGVTSPFAINGSPVQILVSPSLGGFAPESPEARLRRCKIRDEIEVIPMEMSGLSSGPNGVERTWGDPL